IPSPGRLARGKIRKPADCPVCSHFLRYDLAFPRSGRRRMATYGYPVYIRYVRKSPEYFDQYAGHWHGSVVWADDYGFISRSMESRRIFGCGPGYTVYQPG